MGNAHGQEAVVVRLVHNRRRQQLSVNRRPHQTKNTNQTVSYDQVVHNARRQRWRGPRRVTCAARHQVLPNVE